MSVEVREEHPKTVEQLKVEILGYANKAEFGSGEYRAISDYLNLQFLENHWRIEYQNLLSKQSQESKLSSESHLRISEMKIALLEHEIKQNESRIKGYGHTYVRLTSLFEDELAMAVNREEKQGGEATQLYDEVLYDTLDAIYRKQEQDSS